MWRRIIYYIALSAVLVSAGIGIGLWISKIYFNYESAQYVSNYFSLTPALDAVQNNCVATTDSYEKQRLLDISTIVKAQADKNFKNYLLDVFNVNLLVIDDIYKHEDSIFILSRFEQGARKSLLKLKGK